MVANDEADSDGLASERHYGDAYWHPCLQRDPVSRLGEGVVSASIGRTARKLFLHRDNAIATVYAYRVQRLIVLVPQKYMDPIVGTRRSPLRGHQLRDFQLEADGNVGEIVTAGNGAEDRRVGPIARSSV